MEDALKAEQNRYPVPLSAIALACGIVSLLALCVPGNDTSSSYSLYSSEAVSAAETLGRLIGFSAFVAPLIMTFVFGVILNAVSLLAKSKGCALGSGILYTFMGALVIYALFNGGGFEWYYATIAASAVLPYVVYAITYRIEWPY